MKNQSPFVSDCYNRQNTFPREKKVAVHFPNFMEKIDFLSTFLSYLCQMLKIAFYYKEMSRDVIVVLYFFNFSFITFPEM